MPIANTPLTAARRADALDRMVAEVDKFLAAAEEVDRIAEELDVPSPIEEAYNIGPELVRRDLRLVTAGRGRRAAWLWLFGRVQFGDSLENIGRENYSNKGPEWQAIKMFEERFAAAHPELMPFLNTHPTEPAKPTAEAADRIYAAVEAMMIADDA